MELLHSIWHDVRHSKMEMKVKRLQLKFADGSIVPILFTTLILFLLVLGLTDIPAWSQRSEEDNKIFLPFISNHISLEGATWKFQRIADPHYFKYLTGRNIQVDAKGSIHIVYGDDHLYHAVYDGVSWQVTTVDTTPYTGIDSSFVLDEKDQPHVSYYDSHTLDLKYAHYDKTSSTWQVEVVDRIGDVGQSSSIAIGKDGSLHISYLDMNKKNLTVFKKNLKYAKRVGNSWSISVVDSANGTGRSSSIAIDSQNNPHIIYEDETNRRPKYAKWTGNSWAIQTVSNTGYGGENSLVLDAQDRPHFVNNGTAGFYYVTLEDGKWKNRLVEGGGRAGGRDGTLVLDNAGKPHVLYEYGGLTAVELIYATFDGTTWTLEPVDGCTGGADSSLTLDSAGIPHIVYIKSCSNDDYTPAGSDYLMYATRKNGSWQTQKFERSNIVGQYLKMNVDSRRAPHFVYQDRGKEQLLYATLQNGQLITEALSVPPPPPYQGYNRGIRDTEIAVDHTNSPHIVISYDSDDRFHSNVTHISKTIAGWQVQTIYTDSHVVDVSLAIDSKNYPHVAFVSENSLKRVLRYAHQTEQGWEFQIIEPFTKTEYTVDFPYLSLKLDSNDTPHLAYVQLVNIDQPPSLTYAVLTNGSWQKETVTQTRPGGPCCMWVTLALDGANHPHITAQGCCDSTGYGTLIYATKNEAGWNFALPVKDLGCWFEPVVAVDPSGKPWISCAKFADTKDPDTNDIETLHIISLQGSS